MHLHIVDWALIALFLSLSLIIGLYFRKRASGSLHDFFLSGRRLPWYIAGISMVATTFAADTPLAVTELVAVNGISGNWLWWNMLIGGMLTTFFFARLWRKAEVLTEPELIELRYGGKTAAFLRGFKAFYLGLFMNAIIIAWVNLAFMSILAVFFNIPQHHLIWYAAAAMAVTAVYSAISGLWGVAITDAVQFVIAMTGCIVLAVIVVSSEKIGGISGLKEQLPPWSLDFFPRVGEGTAGTASTLIISAGAFLAFVGVQWWSSWYPGAEPGGGGYVAQRMMSCKNERHSVFATLFFQIAHYCLRPWPWIIVGLATLVLYPGLGPEEKRLGYVFAMRDFLPTGLKGLLLVAFLAAYMSTISTQLNWGASFLVNDFYKRFLRNDSRRKTSQKHYLGVSRIATVLIMVIALVVTTQVKTISGVWSFIIECGAGLGLVLILRWYWWRINAWSELTATLAPFVAYAFSKFVLEPSLPESFVLHRGSFFVTTAFTTVTWIVVTFLTRPEKNEVLLSFYQRVQPGGWWKPVKSLQQAHAGTRTAFLFLSWISAIVMTYSILFLTGKIIFAEWGAALNWAIATAVSLPLLIYSVKKSNTLTTNSNP
jgi:solute:Na+ symporter, SSS family